MGSLAVALFLVLPSCAPVLQEPGRYVQEARLGDDRFTASDGVELKLRVWRPAGQPRAAILALHGFNDYRNAFDASATEWAKAGVVTYAYDQRGFGEAPEQGIWPGTALLARDAADMARLLRARHADIKFYLLGESMGGAVTVVAMANDQPPPIDGVILAAPALWGREGMSAIQRETLDFLAHTMPWFPVSGQGTGRVPSDNIPMLRGLGADPLVQKYNRIDTVWGLVNLMDDAQAAAPRFSATALILYGDNEQLIPKGPVDRFLKNLPREAAGRQRLAVYPHGFHMLLRDLGAETVRQDVQGWIADPKAPLPSGTERKIGE